MKKKINYIIREVPPEQAEFSFYFDDDGLTEKGGDYCYNLFIVAQSRNSSGFNEKEYQSLQTEIENLLEMYVDIVNKSNYAQYSSVGAMLFDLGLVSSIHNTRRIKEITEWLKACLSWGNTSQTRTLAEYEPEETTAEYLTFKTGKQWDTDEAYGYCQGDYVKMVYCSEHYKDGAKHYGEVWLGAAKEFYTIEIDENGEEGDACYGYIIADCQALTDEDYKNLVCDLACIPEEETRLEMIDGSRTYTKYNYRTAWQHDSPGSGEKGKTMKQISLDNGHTYMTAQEAMPEITERDLWDAVVNLMDDDTREAVHADMAPCTEAEFLAAYLERATNDLIIG